MKDYTETSKETPPEDVVLETISEGGASQELIFHMGLFFFKDMSMYVYYTPKFWRVKQESCCR